MSLPVEEKWQGIPGYPHYEASTFGRIRSLDRRCHRGQVIKQHCVNWNEERGYRQVVLSENYERFTLKVHRLVALTFIPNPDGFPIVRHLDGDPENNYVGNLAWGDHEANMADMVQHGNHLNARKTHCPNGHPLSGEHLEIVTATGSRRCRTCRNARRRINPEPTWQRPQSTGPTPYKGVGWDKRRQCWTAQVTAGNRRMRYLGSYSDPAEAARAYDEAAFERWGHVAVLNFPRAHIEVASE